MPPAAVQMKEEQASDFILSMRQDRETSIPLGIDPALLLAAKRGKGRLSAGFLAACIATMMLPLKQCAVIAGNGAMMRVRKPCRVSINLFCMGHYRDAQHQNRNAQYGQYAYPQNEGCKGFRWQDRACLAK